jgi:hypothetical protein
MKKLMAWMVGLSFVLGTASLFAQEPKKEEQKVEKKKKKGTKKKEEKKKEEKPAR